MFRNKREMMPEYSRMRDDGGARAALRALSILEAIDALVAAVKAERRLIAIACGITVLSIVGAMCMVLVYCLF